eukprot:10620528-Alexandrium_andersonii.AAC.1
MDARPRATFVRIHGTRNRTRANLAVKLAMCTRAQTHANAARAQSFAQQSCAHARGQTHIRRCDSLGLSNAQSWHACAHTYYCVGARVPEPMRGVCHRVQ